MGDDPLLEDFKSLRRRIFHWHGERWLLPTTLSVRVQIGQSDKNPEISAEHSLLVKATACYGRVASSCCCAQALLADQI